MYVEFRLTAPGDRSSVRAEMALHLINVDLHTWSDKYDIPYNTKLHKLTKRVFFDNPETYSFFALTFEPTNYCAKRWSLIEPMSRPKSID